MAAVLALWAALAAGPAPAGRWAPLTVELNGVARGETDVYLRGKDALLPSAVLDLLGLAAARRLPAFVVETVDERNMVSLARLCPPICFTVKEEALTLSITAPLALLGHGSLDLGARRRPADLVLGGGTSGFLNYGAHVDDHGALVASSELGLRRDSTLFLSSVSRGPDGRVVRGLTFAAVDSAENLRRFTAGDQLASGGAGDGGLGGALLLAGVGVSREFSLDPYFTISSYPTAQLAVTTPSVLDVYVNGSLVRQVTVPAGTLDLTNVPVSQGAGSVRYVLRDAFGRTQELSSGYYFTGGLLAPGVTDYAFRAGFRRLDPYDTSFSYGAPAVLARHRAGLTDWLTGGLRLDAAPTLASGGGSLTAGTPLGELELSGAASADGRDRGLAGALGWRYGSRWGVLGASLRALGPRYANASLAATDDRALWQLDALGSVPLFQRATLGAGYGLASRRDTGRLDRATLTASVRLARGLGAFATVSLVRPPGGAAEPEVMAMLTWSPSSKDSMSATAVSSGGEVRPRLDASRSLGRGPGFGYRLQGQAGAVPSAWGYGQVQSEVVRLEGELRATPGAEVMSLGASGAFALVGGEVRPTLPVDQSFALVRVGKLRNVRTYFEGQEMGRTDEKGELLVPNLLAHYANRIQVKDVDVPLDWELDRTQELVAPPWRGGAVVDFKVRPRGGVSGVAELETPTGAAVPAFGDFVLYEGGQALESPIGRDGAFYVEGASPGVHRAEIRYRDAVCGLNVLVPEPDGAPATQLGKLHCHTGVLP